MKKHRYTKEQCEWIRQNYPALGAKEALKAFQEQYGNVSTLESFKSKVRDLGIHVTTERWKEACQNNGYRTNSPIGTIVTRGRGENFIKVADGTQGWIPLKQHLVGKIKKDEMVVHLDGNKANDEMSNLLVINRKTGAAMTGNGFWSKDREITRTGIICCQLDMMLQDGKGE